jgi:hypothetical protein
MTRTRTVVSNPTITVAAELTDRCDRCGAAGKLRIVLAAGGELVFCGHHANRYADDIGGKATHVVLESGFGWRGTNQDQ